MSNLCSVSSSPSASTLGFKLLSLVLPMKTYIEFVRACSMKSAFRPFDLRIRCELPFPILIIRGRKVAESIGNSREFGVDAKNILACQDLTI